MKTMVYVGASDGTSLRSICGNYDRVYAFEPLPDNFHKLEQCMKNHQNVSVINAACGSAAGSEKFYVTKYNNSSSLGQINNELLTTKEKQDGGTILETIVVNVINLHDYLIDNKITEIDTLVTDCQGSDFNILSTVVNSDIKIHNIVCETHNNNRVLYHGLDNTFFKHKQLLKPKYEFLFGVPSGDDNVPRLRYSEQQLENIPQLTEWDSHWKLRG